MKLEHQHFLCSDHFTLNGNDPKFFSNKPIEEEKMDIYDLKWGVMVEKGTEKKMKCCVQNCKETNEIMFDFPEVHAISSDITAHEKRNLKR